MKLVFIGIEREPYEITAAAITLGAGDEADLTISAPGVADIQARLVRIRQGYRLEDMCGATRLNGQVLGAPAVLHDGDMIEFGEITLRVEQDPEPEVDATTAFPRPTLDDLPGKVAAKPAAPAPAVSDQTIAAPATDADPDKTGYSMRVSDHLPPQLLVFRGNEKTHESPITRDETLLGNGPLADVMLDSDLVARRHAKLVRKSEGYRLESLSPDHPVYLNGQRAEQASVGDKDVITLGDMKVIYLEPGTILGKSEIKQILKRGKPVSGFRKKFLRIVIALLVVIVGALAAGKYMGVWEEAPAPKKKPQPAAAPQQAQPDLGADIQEAIKDRDWDAALLLVEKKSKTLEKADELRTQLELERSNRGRYVDIQQNVEDENWEKAVDVFLQIPVDSVYFLMTRQLFAERAKNFCRRTMIEAQRLSHRPKTYGEAMKKSRLVMLLDADNRAARSLYLRLDRATKEKVKLPAEDTEEKITRVSFYKDYQAHLQLYLDGKLEEALKALKALNGTITPDDAATLDLPKTIENLELVITYYNRGIAAKNKKTPVEIINIWEKMIGPALEVADGGIPRQIAEARNEIINYYLAEANAVLIEQGNTAGALKAARLCKQVLVYSADNPQALEKLKSFEEMAKKQVEMGKGVRDRENCAKALPYFNTAYQLTSDGSEVHQEALQLKIECQK